MPHGVKKLSGLDFKYRIRQRNYLIVSYIHDKNKIVNIWKVDDRKDIYK